MLRHIEDGTVLKLSHIEERIEGSTDMKTIFSEWSPSNFVEIFKGNLKKEHYCLPSNEEFQYASSTIRAWAQRKYKGGEDILDPKNEEKLKALIIDEYPKEDKFYKPAWEIFEFENQNTFCDYFIFKQPVQGYEDISIKFLVGFQIINPFVTEMSIKYKTLYIKGSPARIDKFRGEFKF